MTSNKGRHEISGGTLTSLRSRRVIASAVRGGNVARGGDATAAAGASVAWTASQNPEAVQRAGMDLLTGRGPSCPCCAD